MLRHPVQLGAGPPFRSLFRFPKGEGGAPQGAERFMAPFGAPAAALVKRSEECFSNPGELSEWQTRLERQGAQSRVTPVRGQVVVPAG